MHFEWDEAKNKSNTHKHFITFDEAITIFQGETLTEIDDSQDYHETRFRSLGRMIFIEVDAVILVVHTKRGERTRIISARKANRRETGKYYDHVQK